MAIIKYKNAEGEWEDLIYAQTQGGGGVAPARYITEIKTENLINYDNGVAGTWTEYFYNDGTVEAEAVVADMYFSKYGELTDFAFYFGGFGTNCFNNPTNFTAVECWTEIYHCTYPAIMPMQKSNNCGFYPSINIFKGTSSTMPDSFECSYIIKAKGTA